MWDPWSVFNVNSFILIKSFNTHTLNYNDYSLTTQIMLTQFKIGNLRIDNGGILKILGR